MTLRSRLRALLEAFGSVLDLGIGAELPEYRGPEHDAEALRGDWERVDENLRSATDGFVDAHPFLRQSIARDLRAAREQAGLSQITLAGKIGTTIAQVQAAESGMYAVTETHVRAVLSACGLPYDWIGRKDYLRSGGRDDKAGASHGACYGARPHLRVWSSRWDAFYCPRCAAWLEPPCLCLPADDCPFPGERPPDASGEAASHHAQSHAQPRK